MARGRRIAFDYGDVRTGVAICDPDAILVSPHAVLRTQNKGFYDEISSLLEESEPIHIYVGNPLNMSGSEGVGVSKVARFVKELQKITQLPISLIDERLSTVGAQRVLKEAGVSMRESKSLIDAMAACAILEQGLLSENRD
jgi:putative Holliday junction resolvase